MRVTATDKDGGVSSQVQQHITITAVAMQGGDLVVGGTTGNDNINLKVANTNGGVKVTISGVEPGHVHSVGSDPGLRPGRHGQRQVRDDQVQRRDPLHPGRRPWSSATTATTRSTPAAPAPTTSSSAAPATTSSTAAWAATSCFGGLGADTLRGGGGEDLLIGNGTVHDNNLAALLALMAEWGRTDLDYVSRAQHLTGLPGGVNGDVYLNPLTIVDDAAIDQLYGESGLDLFFAASSGPTADNVNDEIGSEWIILL